MGHIQFAGLLAIPLDAVRSGWEEPVHADLEEFGQARPAGQTEHGQRGAKEDAPVEALRLQDQGTTLRSQPHPDGHVA